MHTAWKLSLGFLDGDTLTQPAVEEVLANWLVWHGLRDCQHCGDFLRDNCAQSDSIFGGALVVKSTEMESAVVDAGVVASGTKRIKRVDSTFVDSLTREELRLLAIGNILPE
jgi:hypothetical protein